MLDFQRIGEVAGRSLYPCLPQVVTDAEVWLHSPLSSPRDALRVHSRSGMTAYMYVKTIRDLPFNRISRGDDSAHRRG